MSWLKTLTEKNQSVHFLTWRRMTGTESLPCDREVICSRCKEATKNGKNMRDTLTVTKLKSEDSCRVNQNSPDWKNADGTAFVHAWHKDTHCSRSVTRKMMPGFIKSYANVDLRSVLKSSSYLLYFLRPVVLSALNLK